MSFSKLQTLDLGSIQCLHKITVPSDPPEAINPYLSLVSRHKIDPSCANILQMILDSSHKYKNPSSPEETNVPQMKAKQRNVT